MIAERPCFRGGACRQNMSIEGRKQRALINEVVTRIADQSDAVEQQPPDEFGGDYDRIHAERKV